MADEQNHLEEVLKGRFVKRVLKEAGSDINAAQVKYIVGKGFKNSDWLTGRSFLASESALVYAQLLKVRFVDMKNRKNRKKNEKRKVHQIHNKMVWGHYNNIIREMAFGFTEAVKQELRTLE